jgi:NodT family efflux transporter outer membrane factor (OMF) lipoprotein
LEQSKAITAGLSSQTLPNINVFGQVLTNRQSENRPLRGSNQPNTYGANTLGLSIDYDLDLWGRISNQIKSGKALEQATLEDYANAKIGFQTEIAFTYLELRRLDHLISLYTNTIAVYEKQLKLTNDLHNEGVASGLDVARAKAQFERAKEQILIAKTNRSLMEHALAVLLGRLPSDFSIEVATVNQIKLVPVSPGIPSTLLERRPDISSALNRLISANEEIGAAKKAYFPNIMLGLNAGFQNDGGLGLLKAPNLFWALGPSAILNVFDGGRREASIRLAEAKRNQLASDYKLQVLKAFQQVEDCLVRDNILEERYKTSEREVSANQALYDRVMNRYYEGIDSYFEVTIANQDLLKSKENLINLTYQKLESRLALIHSLGGGWSRD